MAKRDFEIFKINVLNFQKHNSQLKKGHKATLISNNFCDDPKLRVVPQPVGWLLLAVILMCGDQSSDVVEVTESQLRGYLKSSWSVTRALDALQELQILTYEKIPLFTNRIEKKGKEKKGIEVTREVEKSLTKTQPSKLKTPELNRKIWDEYRDAYFSRYAVDPVRNASVNGKISQIAARLGAEGPAVVRFYVEHPNTFYVKNLHAIGLCLSDAESLRTQWAKGKPITSADVRNYESNQEHQQLLTAIAEGRI